MKRLIIGLLALVVLMAPALVVAQTTDFKAVNVSATWTGGVSLSIDKVALTYPVMTYPHDNLWKNSNEGFISATIGMSVNPGRRVRFSMTTSNWIPAIAGMGPETTVQLQGVNGSAGAAIFVPPVGGELVLWTTTTSPPETAVDTFEIRVRNVAASLGTRTMSLTFTVADVL